MAEKKNCRMHVPVRDNEQCVCVCMYGYLCLPKYMFVHVCAHVCAFVYAYASPTKQTLDEKTGTLKAVGILLYLKKKSHCY